MTQSTEQTSGTPVREPRDLTAGGGVFDLADAMEELKKEPQWEDGDRNAVTLVHEGSLRVVLTGLRPGARIGDDDTNGRQTLHVLSGEVEITHDAGTSVVGAGYLATLGKGTPWAAVARGESFLLLTIAWPERENEASETRSR
jgi:quercetin dioxygenase-like cupin family protein